MALVVWAPIQPEYATHCAGSGTVTGCSPLFSCHGRYRGESVRNTMTVETSRKAGAEMRASCIRLAKLRSFPFLFDGAINAKSVVMENVVRVGLFCAIRMLCCARTLVCGQSASPS